MTRDALFIKIDEIRYHIARNEGLQHREKFNDNEGTSLGDCQMSYQDVFSLNQWLISIERLNPIVLLLIFLLVCSIVLVFLKYFVVFSLIRYFHFEYLLFVHKDISRLP